MHEGEGFKGIPVDLVDYIYRCGLPHPKRCRVF